MPWPLKVGDGAAPQRRALCQEPLPTIWAWRAALREQYICTLQLYFHSPRVWECEAKVPSRRVDSSSCVCGVLCVYGVCMLWCVVFMVCVYMVCVCCVYAVCVWCMCVVCVRVCVQCMCCVSCVCGAMGMRGPEPVFCVS